MRVQTSLGRLRDPKSVVHSTPDAAIRLKYRMAIRSARPQATDDSLLWPILAILLTVVIWAVAAMFGVLQWLILSIAFWTALIIVSALANERLGGSRAKGLTGILSVAVPTIAAVVLLIVLLRANHPHFSWDNVNGIYCAVFTRTDCG